MNFEVDNATMPSVVTTMDATPIICSAPFIGAGSIKPSRKRLEARAITAREMVIAITLIQIIVLLQSATYYLP
jgi:hypothetical protein